MAATTRPRYRRAPITIPGRQLVLYVLLTAAAGVLASFFPARRAARLDVLPPSHPNDSCPCLNILGLGVP